MMTVMMMKKMTMNDNDKGNNKYIQGLIQHKDAFLPL